mgnify:CR=1 FL=1|nr:MAG TPA: hypothetical protein [Caudoviricetes sp.]
MEEYKNDGKYRLGIKIDESGKGRWALGLNIAYEAFEDYEGNRSSELYLNIYLIKYQIIIGKMLK